MNIKKILCKKKDIRNNNNLRSRNVLYKRRINNILEHGNLWKTKDFT